MSSCYTLSHTCYCLSSSHPLLRQRSATWASSHQPPGPMTGQLFFFPCFRRLLILPCHGMIHQSIPLQTMKEMISRYA